MQRRQMQDSLTHHLFQREIQRKESSQPTASTPPSCLLGKLQRPAIQRQSSSKLSKYISRSLARAGPGSLSEAQGSFSSLYNQCTQIKVNILAAKTPQTDKLSYYLVPIVILIRKIVQIFNFM